MILKFPSVDHRVCLHGCQAIGQAKNPTVNRVVARPAPDVVATCTGLDAVVTQVAVDPVAAAWAVALEGVGIHQVAKIRAPYIV